MRQSTDREEEIPSYLGKLTQAPLLGAEEELALTSAAQQGDEKARLRLIESNMRLVINIAKSYRTRSVPIEDLIQEGAIGLMHAVDRFDPSKGFRFSTYATHWIRQSIGRALDNKSKAIRLPAHVSQSLRKIERERHRLMRELGHDPTHEELATALGVSPRKLTLLLQSSMDMLSLDMRIGEGDSTTLGALLEDETSISPEDVAMANERLHELHEIMTELTDRERRVMMQRLKMDEDEELSSVRDRLAKELMISRERIRQIELQAIKKLRTVAQQRRFREIMSR
ncbi:MAG: RNA polymerase sigma factor RpoD/SigA [Fimbriimonadaceae bacterium]|nr:RNA polymerase sigma factor RpoD/SigA [Fimbriimonadaceae bacterium]MCC7101934.1 RNA polymerase sigma factor RpoD/SigA [Fimbriimonadaceae bacterium]